MIPKGTLVRLNKEGDKYDSLLGRILYQCEDEPADYMVEFLLDPKPPCADLKVCTAVMHAVSGLELLAMEAE